ncbi:MAG: sigma factor [Burkholderiaceae bacterium]
MSEDRDIEALLARVGMGDRAAFKSLYDRAAGVMLSTAVRVLQDRTAAEDVVQDVFAGLWHKASDTLAPCTRNLGWLCVVTRNRALDHLRRRPREAPLQVSTEAAIQRCMKRHRKSRAHSNSWPSPKTSSDCTPA